MTVICWFGNLAPFDKSIGHAALQFEDGTGPDDGYISWWPTFAATPLCQVGPGQAHTYESDLASEGRKPEFVKKLFNLDRSEIDKFWKEWKKTPKYDLANRNCCDCVFGALAAGGAELKAAAIEDRKDEAVYIPSQIKALTEELAARPDNCPI